MSAPSRGRGGGVPRGSSTATTQNRGSGRAAFSNTSRGRGRGRGSSGASPSAAANDGGVLQKLRAGTLQRNGDTTQTNSRGRGATMRGQAKTTRVRGSTARTSSTSQRSSSASSSQASSAAPVTSTFRDFTNQMTEKYNLLKPRRDVERKKAIKDGFLSDPDQKTSLDKAITPVGTCTEMCPEFERVERIVQNMVDKAEKVMNTTAGRDIPSEDKMVKRFRRSAAGYDEQLPSDIRTPETLQKTLDYLLDKVVDVERLASIHKFVWDRTRGIRNDFSIQQVSRQEDVKIAVDCYERIARFHVLSMHQLSNPHNLQEGEYFSAQQEREQLNNTLLSLMYYYDDHRDTIPFPNEAEFRSYCILFELQSLHPDLEERMQSWPRELLDSPQVQTAFKLYAAAGNSIFDQGPLRPFIPYSLAQSNSGKFWSILASQQVSYMMACVAEMNFNQVRFAALDALWRSCKSAPQGQQSRNQDWTMDELTKYLGFDDEDQTLEFVQEFGLAFGTAVSGEQYLDMTALSSNTLDKSSIPSQQIFSASVVEEKRYRRTLVAVINGVNVATAIREGLVVETPQDDSEMDTQDISEDEQSLFIPEQSTEQPQQPSSVFGNGFNPQAPAFTPSAPSTDQSAQKPLFGSTFGSNINGPTTKSGFGTPSAFQQALSANNQDTAQPDSVTTANNTPFSFKPQSDLTKTALTPPSNIFKGFGPVQQPTNTTGFASNPVYPTFKWGQPPQAPPIEPQNQSQMQSTSGQIMNGSVSDAPSIFSQPQFGQNIAAKLGSGQPFSGDAATIPSTGQSFGANFFSQPQAREKTPEEKKAILSTAASAPASTTPFIFQQPGPIGGSQQKLPSFSLPASTLAPASQYSTTFPQPAILSKQGTQEAQPQSSVPPIFPTPPQAKLPEAGNVFNFPKTIEKSKPSPQTSLFPNVREDKASTTPLGTPVKTNSSNFKFPAFEQTQALAQASSALTPASHSTADSSPRQLSSQTQNQFSLAATQAPTSLTQSGITPVDRAKLVEDTARLLLIQPEGLLEYFIGNHISSIVEKVARAYQKDQLDRTMNYLKTRFLSRKFYILWKNITQQSVLNRRAKQRRKMLAVAMRAEQQKKRRNEEELELIIAATQETKRIQEQQRQSKEAAERYRLDAMKLRQQEAAAVPSIGQKRKTLAEGDNRRSISGTPLANSISHKRSRTVGSISEPSMSMRSSSPSNSSWRQSAASSRFTQSFFGRSTGSSDSRRSSQKVDNTKSDYFKLKAMGIDPDTPLIPDTARSLALKQQRASEEREASLSRIRARHVPPAASLRSPKNDGSMQPPPRQATEATTSISSTESRTTSNVTQTSAGDEDEFLKELREARQAMSQDAEWFKTQTASIEKEVQQQETMQRNRQVQQPAPQVQAEVFRISTNGLARANNGYEYLPSSKFNPGQSLSRTEQRIRQTGAHGLATKPLGRNSTSVTTDYLPVAMSKRSALRYSMSSHSENEHVQEQHQQQQSNTTKRTRVISPTHPHQRSSEGSEHILHNNNNNNNESSSPIPKRHRKDDDDLQSLAISAMSRGGPISSRNSFAASNDVQDNYDDDEEEVEEQEPANEEEEEEADIDISSYRNGDEADADGDTEDLYDDDELEEDEDEAEDEDELLLDNDGEVTRHAYLTNKLSLEERIYDNDEDEEDVDEDIDNGVYGDDDNTDGYSAAFGYPTISHSHSHTHNRSRGTSGSGTSGSQSASACASQAGPGATEDDALVLSD